MKYGFLRTAAGSPELRVADCRFNTQKIIEMMHRADGLGVEFLVLPELCVTGYTCGDLFHQECLLAGAEQSLKEILSASQGMQMITVLSLPVCKDQKLYNCAAVICGGHLLGLVPKTHLPNYGEFYEARQFTPAPEGISDFFYAGQTVLFGKNLLFRHASVSSFCFGVEICEDLWVPNPPSVGLAMAGALLIANPSASDEVIGKTAYRRNLVASQSGRLVCGYLYAGAGEGESTTDVVYSGCRLIAENGSILEESPLFTDGLSVAEIDLERLAAERRHMSTFHVQESEEYETVYFDVPLRQPADFCREIAMRPFVPADKAHREERCREILRMQAAGLKKRLAHTNSRTAVIGISGGLDSTLALLVAVEAMDSLSRPRTDILAVTMPCFGTTSRTKSNAEKLCEALGVSFRTVPIADAVHQHFRDIGQDENTYDVTYENGQARERTQVLMDLANKTWGMVIGTGDLSELALGWATYNGDHMSMYGVNCSIPKTLVRHLVQYYADQTSSRTLRDTLLDILDTPVSPELLPAVDNEISQKTEDLVGPYDLHDFFLYYLVRCGFAPDKIYFLAKQAFEGVFSDEIILKWLKVFLRRFFQQQFKRSCLPDGPKVGTVTLSPRGDWRMPSDACAALWLESLEHLC